MKEVKSCEFSTKYTVFHVLSYKMCVLKDLHYLDSYLCFVKLYSTLAGHLSQAVIISLIFSLLFLISGHKFQHGNDSHLK